MQLKRHSLLEAILGTVIGYVISLTAQHFIYPMFGIHISFMTNVQLTNFFTVISIVRGYYVRRAFNWAHSKGILR